MRKEFCQHTMSARANCGFQGARAAKSDPGSLLPETLTNKPLHNRIRTRSFGLSHGLCSVWCVISVLCLAELLQCFSSHESCVTGCHFTAFFGSTFLHTSGSRQASNHDRTASVGLFSQDTRVCWSLLDNPPQVNICATTAARRRRSAEHQHGSFATVKTHASSRLSGHRARVNLFAESRHCFVFRCSFSSGTARARSFSAHPSQRSTAAAALQASLAARLHGKLCEISFKTHLLGLTWDPSCRQSETSTFGLCKAADVQRSGPRPGRRAHEAV